MFYETQRIIHKQQKYVKSKAYDVIDKLKKGGHTGDSAISQIDLLLSGECTEIETDIYKYAIAVIKSRKETELNESISTNYIDNSRSSILGTSKSH